MASLVKDKIKTVTGHSNSIDDEEAKQEAEKYRLIVTAGGSYDISAHEQVPVNTGEAVLIENDFIKAKVKVRIREYKGLPSRSPSSSPYFDSPKHSKDQYSIAFSFVPKQDLPSVDTVWGNDFDHPVRDRLPPGFNTAFKIVKEFIDPGLSCDAYADKPWLYGPSLSCWFAFRIGDKFQEGDDFPAPSEDDPMEDGADGSGAEARRKLGIPDDSEKRRKHFLNSSNREDMVFEKGRVYQADFFNPYIDFGNFALRLPGFSLKVIKYVDQKSHCLRYVFKNRESGDVYLNVDLRLLWGDDLAKALEAEKREQVGGGQTGQAQEKTQEGVRGAAQGDGVPRSSQRFPKREPGGSGQTDQAQVKTQESILGAAQADGMPHSSERQSEGAGIEQARNFGEESKSVDSGRAVASSTPAAEDKASLPDGRDEIAEMLQATSTSDSRSVPDPQQSGSNGGSEISDMLQATSTSDRRGSGEAILDMKN